MVEKQLISIYPFENFDIMQLIAYSQDINVFMDDKYSYTFSLKYQILDSKYNGILSYIILLKEKTIELIGKQGKIDCNYLNECISELINKVSDVVDLYIHNNKVPLPNDIIECFEFDKNNAIVYPYLNNVIRFVMNCKGYDISEDGSIKRYVIKDYSLLVNELILKIRDSETFLREGMLFSSINNKEYNSNILTELSNNIKRSDYFCGESNVKKLTKIDHVLKLKKY